MTVRKELVKSYKTIASHYDRVKKNPWKDFQKYYERVTKLFPLPSAGIVVDAGAGNCRNLLIFEDENWRKIAIDISIDLLETCTKKKNVGLELVVADIANMPIRNNSADLITCIAVLHHFDTEKAALQALKTMRAILRPNGFLILSVWRRWRKDIFIKMLIELFMSPFKKLLNKHYRHGDYYLPWRDNQRNVIGYRYYHLFTKNEIKALIKEANFEICDFITYGGKSGKDNFFLLLKRN